MQPRLTTAFLAAIFLSATACAMAGPYGDRRGENRPLSSAPIRQERMAPQPMREERMAPQPMRQERMAPPQSFRVERFAPQPRVERIAQPVRVERIERPARVAPRVIEVRSRPQVFRAPIVRYRTVVRNATVVRHATVVRPVPVSYRYRIVERPRAAAIVRVNSRFVVGRPRVVRYVSQQVMTVPVTRVVRTYYTYPAQYYGPAYSYNPAIYNPNYGYGYGANYYPYGQGYGNGYGNGYAYNPLGAPAYGSIPSTALVPLISYLSQYVPLAQLVGFMPLAGYQYSPYSNNGYYGNNPYYGASSYNGYPYGSYNGYGQYNGSYPYGSYGPSYNGYPGNGYGYNGYPNTGYGYNGYGVSPFGNAPMSGIIIGKMGSNLIVLQNFTTPTIVNVSAAESAGFAGGNSFAVGQPISAVGYNTGDMFMATAVN
jgi:hypothetical protein